MKYVAIYVFVPSNNNKKISLKPTNKGKADRSKHTSKSRPAKCKKKGLLLGLPPTMNPSPMYYTPGVD